MAQPLLAPLPHMTGFARAQFIERRLREPMRRIARHLVHGGTHLSPAEHAVVAELPDYLHHMTGYSDDADTCGYVRYAPLTGIRYDVHAFTFALTFEWVYEQKLYPLYVVAYIGTDDKLHAFLPDSPFPEHADATKAYDGHARKLGFDHFAALLAEKRHPADPKAAQDAVRCALQYALTGRILEPETSPLSVKGARAHEVTP